MLYGRVMAAARRPALYSQYQVPDNVEGRYDCLVLHMSLLFYVLKPDTAEADAFRQDLFDYMFRDMDLNLRELGIGDMGIGKRMRKLMEKFYGRMHAYHAAFVALGNDGGIMLRDVLNRNLYAKVSAAPGSLLAMEMACRDFLTATEGLGFDDILTKAFLPKYGEEVAA
jgi:cytochrome b pre-mRNA-processing protein 3